MDNETFLHALVEGFGNWFEDEKRVQDGRITPHADMRMTPHADVRGELYPYTALFSPGPGMNVTDESTMPSFLMASFTVSYTGIP